MSASLTIMVDHLSQPARAVALLCRTIKAPHNEKIVLLLKGELKEKPFTDITPFHKVPVVQDGDLLILESCSGLRYIASKYDSSGQWYPSQVEVRAKVDEYLDWQHANTRAHGAGYFFNKLIVPFKEKTEPDMPLVTKHATELKRVEEQFVSYFLGPRPFITGDQPTIADLLAACEFEQPLAGGYQLSAPIVEYLGRVKDKVPQYDELHASMRALATKLLG